MWSTPIVPPCGHDKPREHPKEVIIKTNLVMAAANTTEKEEIVLPTVAESPRKVDSIQAYRNLHEVQTHGVVDEQTNYPSDTEWKAVGTHYTKNRGKEEWKGYKIQPVYKGEDGDSRITKTIYVSAAELLLVSQESSNKFFQDPIKDKKDLLYLLNDTFIMGIEDGVLLPN